MNARVVGTWLSPGALYGVFWFVYSAVPIAALPSFPTNALAIFYILGSCICFSVPALIFPRVRSFDRTVADGQISYDTKVVRTAFALMTAAALVATYASTVTHGFSPFHLFSNPIETSSQLIARRYGEELQSSILGQLGTVFTYPAAVLGGMLYFSSLSGYRKLRIFLYAMLPSLYTIVYLGAKGTVFLAISLFWSGILVCRIRRRERSVFAKADCIKILVYCAALAPVVIASFLARGLYDEDFDSILIALRRLLASYSTAHLYAFSDWFTYYTEGRSAFQYADRGDTSLGFYTFMAVFRALGDERYVAPGVYTEYFTYLDLIQTNIFTTYRGLIVDFGLTGSLLFMVLVGGICHWIFLRAWHRPSALLSMAMYTHMIGFFYTSFIISLLIWNSIYASLVVLYGVFWINRAAEKQGFGHRYAKLGHRT